MDMVFRALAIYLFLVVVFKVAGRRALLQMTSFDLILLLIISEATQQALLGQDFSVTGAMITITGGHGDFRLPHEVPRAASQGLSHTELTRTAAIADGADHIVVGRPIWQAKDPAAAARAVVAELS